MPINGKAKHNQRLCTRANAKIPPSSTIVALTDALPAIWDLRKQFLLQRLGQSALD